jgi:hypothetical protein
MMFHGCLMLHVRKTSEQLLTSFAVVHNIEPITRLIYISSLLRIYSIMSYAHGLCLMVL